MGSFNTTCFLSGQTIAPNDPCLLVPIRQQQTYRAVDMTFNGERFSIAGPFNSTCYPTRFWSPIGSFIDGTYDDYGRSALLDTKTNRAKLFAFFSDALRKAPVVEQGENEYHDHPFDMAAFMKKNAPELFVLCSGASSKDGPAKGNDRLGATPKFNLASKECFSQMTAVWDYIFEVAQEARLFWTFYQKTPVPAGFAIMHRAAYEGLLGIARDFTDWRGNSQAPRAFFDRAVEELAQKTEQLDKAVKGSKADKEANETRRFMMVFDIAQAFRGLGEFEGSNYSHEGPSMMAGLKAFIDKKIDVEALYEHVRPWLEVRAATGAMCLLNKHFEPMVYASQDYDNEIGTAYAKFIAKASRQVSRERKEANYGSFQAYDISVKSTSVLERLSDHCKELDAAAYPLSVRPDEEREGWLVGTFEATAELEPLRGILMNFIETRAPEEVLLATLRLHGERPT